MAELKIVYLDPAELTPYENNTRKHAPNDIESIKSPLSRTDSMTRSASGEKITSSSKDTGGRLRLLKWG